MRRYIKERHLQYSPLERQAYSEKMMAHLEKHPRFQAAKIVLLFHSLPSLQPIASLINGVIRKIYIYPFVKERISD